MRARNVFGYETVNTYYYLNKGEKIPWHDHKAQGFGHGHFVIAGKTLVEQKDLPDLTRTDQDPNLELPFDVPHQVTALEDNTIVSHFGPVNKDVPNKDYTPVPPAKYVNRVMLADGTIVEVPS